MGHRGATHWFVTALTIGLIVSGIGWAVSFPTLGLWLLLGYISHLALDMMTLSGLTVWQPFSDRKYHLLPKSMRVRTGSPIDTLIGVGALSIAMGYAVIISIIPVLALAQKLEVGAR